MMGQQIIIGPQMVNGTYRYGKQQQMGMMGQQMGMMRQQDENWAPDGDGTSGEQQQQMGMMGQQMRIGPQMGMGIQVRSSREKE